MSSRQFKLTSVAVAAVVAVCWTTAVSGKDCGSSVSDFLQTYCSACHDSETQSGGLSLATMTLENLKEQNQDWEKVVRKLRARQMPPPGEKRPDEATYDNATQVIEEKLDLYAAEHRNPGRTQTFRRLTRVEYGNAIRDLLALDVDVSVLLPKDEVSHGFDNITVGDLSPTLLNRYISAAQLISQLAVGSSSAGGGRTIRMRPDITQESHVEGLPIGTRGGVLIPFNFPRSGAYRIAVRLMRDRNEHVEGLRRESEIEFLLDRKRVASFTIKSPKSDTDHQTADNHLHAVIKVSAGPHQVGVTFPAKPPSLIETKRQPYEARTNYHRSPRQLPAVYEVSITPAENDAADAPLSAAMTPSRAAVFICRPTNEQDIEACAKRILLALIRKAFRRPVAPADLHEPMKFFRQSIATDGFDTGIQEALSAILVNPNFLFRIERDPQNVARRTAYAVSDVELASRISFFLWSSLPDDELLSLAEQRRLRDPDVLKQQIHRMLRDPRSESLVTSFASQWLYLRNLESLTPDGRLYPDFDHNLREAFRRETELFFESVMRQDLSVLTLLQADYTFLNERLAKHYGIPHIYGSRFRRVELGAETKRGGLLRHASILSVTSYATRTSPVIRGQWVLNNLVGSPPPPPPDDVPALKDNTVDSTLSVRERLSSHRANPACASCHNLMDPIGFSLEHYDALGRWRELENDAPIDSSGGLPDGSEFSGVAGLEQGLLKRPELFVGTLTEKLLTYALGRGIEHYDAPAVRSVVRKAAANDYRFSAIILGIINSPPFQMRVTE